MQEQLTPREREVLTQIYLGQSSKEVAAQLGITFKTAVCHRSRILSKLDAHNTAEMLLKARQAGWLSGAGLAIGAKLQSNNIDDRVEALLTENESERQSLRDTLADSASLRMEMRAHRQALSVACRENRTLVDRIKVSGEVEPGVCPVPEEITLAPAAGVPNAGEAEEGVRPPEVITATSRSEPVNPSIEERVNLSFPSFCDRYGGMNSLGRRCRPTGGRPRQSCNLCRDLLSRI
jgi:DNA-binding CsgD family transcriptional regulator